MPVKIYKIKLKTRNCNIEFAICISSLYIVFLRNIKHFIRIDIQLYQYEWKLENDKLCGSTTPAGH